MGVAKALEHRRNVPDRQHDQAVWTLLAMAGALFSLVGLVIAIGGYLSINGSAFHLCIGLGLILSGTLVARRHRAGAWTYMAVFAGTVAWALRDIETGSILAVRLIGPALLLLIFAVLMPALYLWRPRRALAVFALLIAGTVGLGMMSLPAGPLAHQTAAATQFLDAETKAMLQ